ncbi:DUF6678 family protein [Dokdonella sp.]|uniref:DUF6678 family protein n=1 Tax=Dokdonella sp. TaxID=2291710 RepID=UPI003528FBBC
MNNTKWEELRIAMLGLDRAPLWRTRDVENRYESCWDGDWLHHIKQGGYNTIEWVEIAAANPEQLRAINSAGTTECAGRAHGCRV